MTPKIEVTMVPLVEALLVLLIGGIGLLMKLPLLFASLGPTAYEQIEKPNEPSARPYNVVVGHGVAIVAALFSLWLLRAFAQPVVTGTGQLNFARVGAAVLACLLAGFINLLLRASQPAAFATAILITMGSYQNRRAVLSIALAVLILAVVGEPLRQLSSRARKNKPLPESSP